jgi:hypothetical protein
MLIVLNTSVIFSQNDTINIDINLPGFGDNSQNNSKESVSESNNTKVYDFLKQITTLIKTDKNYQVGFFLNNNLWITTNLAKEIEDYGEEYKIESKILNTKESSTKNVSIYTKEKSSLAFINGIQIENQLSLSDETNVESAILIVFYVNKGKNPFDEEAINIESINETIKWKDGKGILSKNIATGGREILGGILIKKYMISNCKDLGCNSSDRKRKRKKKDNNNYIFPTGVFQYKSCGILMNEKGDYFISNVPDDTSSFRTNSKKVEKKKTSRRSRGKRRRR